MQWANGGSPIDCGAEMTKARQVLELLAEGPHSARQLAEKTGLSFADVQEAIRTLRRGDRVASVAAPVIYKATSLGEAALAKEPTPRTVLARKNRERRNREERAAALRASEFVHKRVAAPPAADSIVSTAVRGQPALQSAWGAMA